VAHPTALLPPLTLTALTLIALIVCHGHLLLGVVAIGIVVRRERHALMSFTHVARRRAQAESVVDPTTYYQLPTTNY
jgi:hypothetical protein